MFIDFVKNRICRGSNGFNCFLCKVNLVNMDKTFLHVTGDQKHLETLKGFVSLTNIKIDENQSTELINNGIIMMNTKVYRCTFCFCNISVGPNSQHIAQHLFGKKHIAIRENVVTNPADDLVSFEISDTQDNSNTEINYLPNNYSNQENNIDDTEENIFVSEQSNVEVMDSNNFLFSCIRCQDILKTNPALQYHKMFHLNPRNKISDIINFFIKENSKQISCLVCDCIMLTEDDLEKHLNEDIHQKRLVILQCPNNDMLMSIMYLNSALYPNIVVPSATNNVYNTLNEEFCRYLYYLQIICQAVTQKQINTKTFDYNLTTVPQQLENAQTNNFNIQSYFCFICNLKFINENLLYSHLNNDYIHKFRMESIIFIFKDNHIRFTSFNNDEIIECTKCQITFTELNGVVIHLFNMCHLCDMPVECITIGSNCEMLVNDKNLYSCSICNIRVPTDTIMIQHMTSDYHKIKTHNFYRNVNNESYEKVIFNCPSCNMNFFNDKMFLDHFVSQHQKVLQNDTPINNEVYSNPNTTNMYIIPNNPQLISATNNPGIQQYFDSKIKNAYSMPLNNFNYSLNNIINSNVNHQQKITVPMNNYHQNKRNYETSALTRKKNLINFSPRYVQLCIERGDENIFTMNIEKIKILELGISLTFPYKSNRCCIPCGCEVPNDLQFLYEHLRTEKHETNLQNMVDNDRYFANYQDQLSDLELSKAYMHEFSDEWVICYSCGTKIENCEINLKNHIDSHSHQLHHQTCKKSADEIIKLFYNIFENLWYYIEQFSCHLCCATFEFEIDYARHLEDISHLQEVEKRLIKSESLQFDCCVLCSCYWYSKTDYYQKHCRNESHLYILQTRDFTVPAMSSEVKQLLTAVEEIVDRLVKDSDRSTVSGKDMENQLLRSIEQVVKLRYPQAKAYLFGSRISYLSFLDSDLDIYLDCENEYYGLKSKKDIEDLLLKVQDCFFRHNDVWKIDEAVIQTRVPILKLRHKSSNLCCDISFMNSLGVQKSKILGYFVNAYLPCRKMILFLKKWCALCNLTGRRGINNFAISWFVIFYLQVKGILPSVQHLIEQENKSCLVAGWETGVSNKISVKDTQSSIVDLLQGFFTYYSEFNYISDVACPFLGKIMKKSQFSEIDKLPDEMSFYKTQIKEEKIEFFRLYSPMCIQEPIDLSQNITKSVTKLQLRMFKQYCNESATILVS